MPAAIVTGGVARDVSENVLLCLLPLSLVSSRAVGSKCEREEEVSNQSNPPLIALGGRNSGWNHVKASTFHWSRPSHFKFGLNVQPRRDPVTFWPVDRNDCALRDFGFPPSQLIWHSHVAWTKNNKLFFCHQSVFLLKNQDGRRIVADPHSFGGARVVVRCL